MELRSTREMRRNEQISKVMAKKTDTAESPAQARPVQPQAPSDKLTLSQQALAFVDEQNRKLWDWDQEGEDRRDGRIGGMIDAMETKKQELDALSKNLDIMDKCQKIAAAIMRGDRVPPEDLRYLMEHDKEGYKMALALRKPKEDPKDVKSVLSEEDRNGAVEQSGGGEAPTAAVSEASSGGGTEGAGE